MSDSQKPMRHIWQSYVGTTVGRLFIVRYNKGEHGTYDCICSCGTKTTKRASNMIPPGKTQSCGCLVKESRLKKRRTGTHFKTGTTTYKSWVAMKMRCYNKKDFNYKNYGGRGITVCRRWHKFENFLLDMGERPSRKMSLDRINNNKGYSKANCRWATKSQQTRNTRRTRLNEEIVLKARKMKADGLTYKQISEQLNVKYGTIENAINGRSWTVI